MPKKPDDQVGESSGPEVDTGRQSDEQARLTRQEGGGLSDTQRRENWSKAGEPGRPPVALGGSSQGQSDRMPTGHASVSNAPADNPAATPGHRHTTD